ncbi:MAG TPA: energy transducer TonB [Pyrinomonadaceae bacterium]|nr:energy transducer TonB [Pyrinomonadaceae bacterium]
MMFNVNHLKRRASRVSLAALLLSLAACANPLLAQEAPRQEGSLQIKPPMIKPPMGKSQNANRGGVKSSRRRRTTQRRRPRARTVTTRSEQFDNESVTVPMPTKPISGGVLNGKAITLPKPSYPEIAKSANASGMVVVQVTIDEMGDVIEARATSGHELLRAAAVDAARQAKFTPTKLSGQPVKVTGAITYNFVP